jgi:hypothetical protein
LTPPVDTAGQATCNEEGVADGARDADADVIAAGREPGSRPRWRGRLIWLLTIAEAVVLAVAVAIALHYRAEATGLRPSAPPAAGPAGQAPCAPSGLVPSAPG